MKAPRTKLNMKIYNSRKKILFSSIFIFLIGFIVAYFYWGIEPHETIGGFLCGIGLGFSVLAISLKKPQEN